MKPLLSGLKQIKPSSMVKKTSNKVKQKQKSNRAMNPGDPVTGDTAALDCRQERYD